MTSKPDDAEPARDAHLLAALRHAPDCDAAPPPALSARILERARVASASAPPPRRWHGAWRGVLRLWREPQRVAAFATLLVALLLGLLWGSQEAPLLPPPLPPPPEATAAPPAAAEAPVDRAAAKPLADKAQPVARERAVPSTRSAAAPPAVSPPPAALPAPAEPAAARSETTSGSADTATTQGEASADAVLERRRDAAAALGKLAVAPSGGPAFARLDELVAGDGATLSWQRGASSSAHGPAQRRWWALLRDTTRGAWLRDRAGEPASETAWLTLLESSRPALVLWQSEGSIRLRDSAGVLWRTTPDAAQLQALRQASERW